MLLDEGKEKSFYLRASQAFQKRKNYFRACCFQKRQKKAYACWFMDATKNLHMATVVDGRVMLSSVLNRVFA